MTLRQPPEQPNGAESEHASWRDEVRARSDGYGIGDSKIVYRERVPKVGVLTRDRWIGKRVKWHIEWKAEDLWVGAFWRTYRFDAYADTWPYATETWVCVLPCLPLNIIRYHHDARPASAVRRRAVYRAARRTGCGRLRAAFLSITFAHEHESGDSNDA